MGSNCKCNNEGGGCNCHGMMKHDWKLMKAVRMLTAVIILIFVFCIGFQFGEMRSYTGMNRGYSMMRTGVAVPMGAYGATQATVTNSGSTEDYGAPASPTAMQ